MTALGAAPDQDHGLRAVPPRTSASPEPLNNLVGDSGVDNQGEVQFTSAGGIEEQALHLWQNRQLGCGGDGRVKDEYVLASITHECLIAHRLARPGCEYLNACQASSEE